MLKTCLRNIILTIILCNHFAIIFFNNHEIYIKNMPSPKKKNAILNYVKVPIRGISKIRGRILRFK